MLFLWQFNSVLPNKSIPNYRKTIFHLAEYKIICGGRYADLESEFFIQRLQFALLTHCFVVLSIVAALGLGSAVTVIQQTLKVLMINV